MTGVIIKRGNLDVGTDPLTGRAPCEDKGRYWDDVSISQATPKIASKPPAARKETWNRAFLRNLRRNHPSDTLITDY